MNASCHLIFLAALKSPILYWNACESWPATLLCLSGRGRPIWKAQDLSFLADQPVTAMQMFFWTGYIIFNMCFGLSFEEHAPVWSQGYWVMGQKLASHQILSKVSSQKAGGDERKINYNLQLCNQHKPCYVGALNDRECPCKRARNLGFNISALSLYKQCHKSCWAECLKTKQVLW